ncbi:MAG: copper chaperone PCu(A)C [Hyphomicrobiaceae bacterium]|nr:copper chaperone PCu(A)C [Hyphomicrobiaceae bacterium]
MVHSVKVAFAAIVLALAAGVAPLVAAEFKVGGIVIEDPWTRATPAGAKVAAGFMAIRNTGSEPDRLVGGTLASAARVEVHEMIVVDGIMKMSELDKGIEIKPGETVTLKPGGLHIMFLDLSAPVEKGPLVGSLTFEKAGSVEIEYDVSPIGGGKPSSQHHGHHGAGSGTGAMPQGQAPAKTPQGGHHQH